MRFLDTLRFFVTNSSIKFCILVTCTSVGIIIQPKKFICENSNVLAMLIRPGRLKLNLCQKFIMLRILPMVLSCTVSNILRSKSISSPKIFTEFTIGNPSSRISLVTASLSPTSMMEVLSKLHLSPLKLPKSVKMFFIAEREPISVIVHTVVSSA